MRTSNSPALVNRQIPRAMQLFREFYADDLGEREVGGHQQRPAFARTEVAEDEGGVIDRQARHALLEQIGRSRFVLPPMIAVLAADVDSLQLDRPARIRAVPIVEDAVDGPHQPIENDTAGTPQLAHEADGPGRVARARDPTFHGKHFLRGACSEWRAPERQDALRYSSPKAPPREAGPLAGATVADFQTVPANAQLGHALGPCPLSRGPSMGRNLAGSSGAVGVICHPAYWLMFFAIAKHEMDTPTAMSP